MTDEFFKKCSYEAALAMGSQKFVKDYLFPAMRREHGGGFVMSAWHTETSADTLESGFLDGLTNRPAPTCGMAACIGGTLSLITGVGTESAVLGRLLGLDGQSSDALFFKWQPRNPKSEMPSFNLGYSGRWPQAFAEKFADAFTAWEKEQVAEEVILLAMKTNGDCFWKEGTRR